MLAPRCFFGRRGLTRRKKAVNCWPRSFTISSPAHKEQDPQIFIVADGSYYEVLHDIIHYHRMFGNAVICPFDDTLSRRLYGASDFIFMPSRYEPCGMAQMIAQLYGSLPIVMATGGLRDTVEHIQLDEELGRGNGFLL